MKTRDNDNLMMENRRLLHMDTARGLAVIYFMWCHCVNIHNAWIDTWAMPVFFYVMGVFFKPTITWREMLVKKVQSLLIPFFLLSIPSYVQCIATLPIRSFATKLINPFACIHGVGWFLICMFWCYIFYYAIVRLTKYNNKWTLVICLVLSVLSFYASTLRIMGYRIMLPMFLSTTFTVLPFICAGDIMKEWIKTVRPWWENLIVAVTTLAASWGVYLLQFKGGEYIDNWFYGQPYWEVLLLSLLGAISILLICKFLPRWMGFAGEHSLIVLMIHPYFIRILRNFHTSSIVVFIITLTLTLMFTYILSRYLPILDGKRRWFKNSSQWK